VGQTGGLPWSLDILQTKREPIPKGLHLSAQGCARRATLGVIPITPPTLKGLHRGPAWSILAAMPQSLARILVHTVFSTKDRSPSLRDTALRKELHHYLGVILKC